MIGMVPATTTYITYHMTMTGHLVIDHMVDGLCQYIQDFQTYHYFICGHGIKWHHTTNKTNDHMNIDVCMYFFNYELVLIVDRVRRRYWP